MGDHIIDTNVLLVASAAIPDSHFKNSDVPAEQKQVVLAWLMEFRADRQRKLVLDQSFKIWEEYHNKLLRGRDYGSLVVMHKWDLSLVQLVDIAYDENGHACLCPELAKAVNDRADRKFVAAALRYIVEGGECSIVNASDTDWHDCEEPLGQAGIAIEHVIEDWSRAKWREKKQKLSRPRPKK